MSGVTPLWVTAQGGHVKVLIELLRQGADVAMRDPEGRNAIMIASEGGHQHVVKVLLGQNADTRLMDYRGRTAAFMAAEHGHLEVLQVLPAIVQSIYSTPARQHTLSDCNDAAGTLFMTYRSNLFERRFVNIFAV